MQSLRYYAQTLNPELKYLELYILSDVHYGNPFSDTGKFLEQLAYIKNTDNAYIIFNGDLCESALRTSKGDIFRQVGTPQDQRDWMIEHLRAIKDKVLAMCSGNHEDRIYNETGIDISKDIASALGCPYDPDGVYLKLSFGNGNRDCNGRPWVYWINTTHGYGGARTKASKAIKVERQGYMVHADIHAMSHDHVVNAAPDIFLSPDKRTFPDKDTGFMVGKVTAHRKMLIKTNAFLKWGGYSRKGGFPPTDLVTPTIWLRGETIPWPNAKDARRPEVRVVV